MTPVSLEAIIRPPKEQSGELRDMQNLGPLIRESACRQDHVIHGHTRM